MNAFTIQVPIFDAHDSVEIEVRVNGVSRSYQYRVEMVDIEECERTHEIRIQCIRDKISSIGSDWQLVTIGAPTKDSIPIMFRRTGEVG